MKLLMPKYLGDPIERAVHDDSIPPEDARHSSLLVEPRLKAPNLSSTQFKMSDGATQVMECASLVGGLFQCTNTFVNSSGDLNIAKAVMGLTCEVMSNLVITAFNESTMQRLVTQLGKQAAMAYQLPIAKSVPYLECSHRVLQKAIEAADR